MNKLNKYESIFKVYIVRLRIKKTLILSILALNTLFLQNSDACNFDLKLEHGWENGKFEAGLKGHISTHPVFHNPQSQGFSGCEDEKELEKAARKVRYQNRRIAESDEQKTKAARAFTKLAQPLVALGCDQNYLFDLIGSHKTYSKNKQYIFRHSYFYAKRSDSIST